MHDPLIALKCIVKLQVMHVLVPFILAKAVHPIIYVQNVPTNQPAIQ